jgi:hypothetical protein
MGHKGQTLLEYMILIGLVLMALVFMGTDIKRTLQSLIKVTADQIGNQAEADQDYDSRSGHMVNSWSSSSQSAEVTKTDVNGAVGVVSREGSQSDTMTIINQGLTN